MNYVEHVLSIVFTTYTFLVQLISTADSRLEPFLGSRRGAGSLRKELEHASCFPVSETANISKKTSKKAFIKKLIRGETGNLLQNKWDFKWTFKKKEKKR